MLTTPSRPLTKVVGQLRRLAGQPTIETLPDARLLELFITGRDESAFAALVRRHGPMVLGVCRQLLSDPNDADDAFQATFLVLVRKASSLSRRELLGNWLYGVAYRVAVRARARRARRQALEREGVEMLPAQTENADLSDLPPVLHEEVERLPRAYRAPMVLCYFQMKTNEEAARELGCPLGTVKARLARARTLLRQRLARRGWACSAAGLTAVLSGSVARASVPPALVEATVRTALTYIAPAAASGAVVSGNAAALADGVLRTLAAAKVRLVALVLLGLGVLAAGFGGLARVPGAPAAASPTPTLPHPWGEGREGGAGSAPQPPGKQAGEQQKPAAKAAAPRWWKQGATLEREDAGSVSALALSPDGKLALTGHEGGAVRLWNTWTGSVLAAPAGHRTRVRAAAFSADGKSAVTLDDDEVKCWDMPAATVRQRLAWGPLAGGQTTVSADGKTAALALSGGQVQLWRLSAKTEGVTFRAHPTAVSALALSADGKRLATGSSTGELKVWDTATRKELAALPPRSRAPVRGVAFTPDGQTVASAHGRDGAVVWDVAASKERAALRWTSQTAVSVALAPDSSALACGSANGAVRVWDLAQRRPVHTFKIHAGMVHALAFARDGWTLGSAATDATARLWRGEGQDGGQQEPQVSPKELAGLIADLKGTDQLRAAQAVQALSLIPKQAVAALKPLLKPVAPFNPERAARLLADLDSPKFSVREKAMRDLAGCGESVLGALRQAVEGKLGLEVQRRVKKLLEGLERADLPELAFGRRAVDVLERINNAQARELLTTLTGGVAEASLTRHAREALRRMDE